MGRATLQVLESCPECVVTSGGGTCTGTLLVRSFKTIGDLRQFLPKLDRVQVKS